MSKNTEQTKVVKVTINLIYYGYLCLRIIKARVLYSNKKRKCFIKFFPVLPDLEEDKNK
jgi:hypothetical protein